MSNQLNCGLHGRGGNEENRDIPRYAYKRSIDKARVNGTRRLRNLRRQGRRRRHKEGVFDGFATRCIPTLPAGRKVASAHRGRKRIHQRLRGIIAIGWIESAGALDHAYKPRTRVRARQRRDKLLARHGRGDKAVREQHAQRVHVASNRGLSKAVLLWRSKLPGPKMNRIRRLALAPLPGDAKIDEHSGGLGREPTLSHDDVRGLKVAVDDGRRERGMQLYAGAAYILKRLESNVAIKAG